MHKTTILYDAAVSALVEHVYEGDTYCFVSLRIQSRMNFYELTFVICFLAEKCFYMRPFSISEGLLKFLVVCCFGSFHSLVQTVTGIHNKEKSITSCIKEFLVIKRQRKCCGAWVRPERYHSAGFVKQGVEAWESKQAHLSCCAKLSPFHVQ